ncbi:MAG: pantoate--beta-alanine ligase [Chitinophagales bacterium]|nr:pantoate--beta-alanine ligase [Chitinophagales bacterium]MDW8393861.1 pantoate--beta-alanine ligase [Chitinophagales bacterium]
MLLIRKAADLQSVLVREGKKLGFVPTMGALHEGHLSLIRTSKSENDLTCCSIYVNPTQFNDVQDLAAYPRQVERDLVLLSDAGCDVVFLPDHDQMYPQGLHALHRYPLHPLDEMLEGASRPGHFQGVANVVDRLLQLVRPEALYMGQKDFQQVKVVERLLAYRNYPVRLVMCPTVREASGLAMSSRNARLTESQRLNAARIWSELCWIRQESRNRPWPELRQQAISRLNALPDMQVDYLHCCRSDTLEFLINRPDQPTCVVWLIAVVVGGVRLLDNILFET